MSIDTKTVAGRRQLQFSSYQDLLDDARSMSAGPTRQLGNWSLGQVLQHLTIVHEMALDGPRFAAPWFIRVIAPLIKNRFLSGPMRSGFKLPKNAASLLPEPIETAAALAAFEASIARLQASTERKQHAVFGTLSQQEWHDLHMRHAELHLSFICLEQAAVPRGVAS